MKKEIIPTKNGIFLVMSLILGTTLTLVGGGEAKQDMWISILMSFFLVIPMLFIYSRILSMFPGKNLYEISEIALGKILGNILNILYISYFFFLGSLVLRNITEFVQIVSFPETPQYFSALCLILLSFYMVKCGIEVFGRWTRLMIPFLLFLILLITVSSFPKLKFENILPVLYDGWKPILHSTFVIFTFPFGETVIFLTLFHTLEDNKKSFKVFFTGIIVSGALVLIINLRNIFLLGFPNLSDIYFPTYYANTLLSVGNFFQRIEIVSAIGLMLSGLAKFCICLFAVSIGINHLFKHSSYKVFAVPISILMGIFAMAVYQNSMEMIEGIQTYKYIALPFQAVFPPIILFFAWRKKRAMSKT